MKRFVKIMIFAAAFIITGSVPVQADAADTSYVDSVTGVTYYEDGDFTYTVENNKITITDYSNKESEKIEDFVIPNTIDGKKVVAVKNGALKDLYSATSITCSDYMTNVSMESFWGMESLESVTLGKLTKRFCAKGHAYECGAGFDIFAIKEIKLPEGAKYLKLVDGALYSKDGKTLYYRPNDMEGTSYTVKSGTTTIAPYAFYFSRNLKKIVLSKSVTTIRSAAFAYSRIESIHLSENVTTIGANAFNNCKALKSIIIRGKVTTIGKQAFFNCYSLKAIRIESKKLSTVGSNAFSKTKALTKIKVPSSTLKNYKRLLAGKGQKSSAKIIAYN